MIDPPGALPEGIISYIYEHTFRIDGDDGCTYFGYRRNLDSFGPQFEDLQVGMRCRFKVAWSDRAKEKDARAIEIRIINNRPLS